MVQQLMLNWFLNCIFSGIVIRYKWADINQKCRTPEKRATSKLFLIVELFSANIIGHVLLLNFGMKFQH